MAKNITCAGSVSLLILKRNGLKNAKIGARKIILAI